MELAINDPNFTIVLPGACQAQCDFCFWRQEKEIDNWLDILRYNINNLPVEFEQLSISGGEPTLSKYLIPVLTMPEIKRRFKKIVLTSNGYNLLDKSIKDAISNSVNHINISRHKYNDDENQSVFKTTQVPSSNLLAHICDEYEKIGIDVTLNAVINLEASIEDLDKMVSLTKEVGAASLALRLDNSLGKSMSPIFTELNKRPAIYTNECPVCFSAAYQYKGISVSYKSSEKEPSVSMGGVYELIYHPSGKMTTDWDQNILYVKPRETYVKPYIPTGGGCGTRSRGTSGC